MRRQKTYHVTLKDRETGTVCFQSVRVYRNDKTLVNPTPGVCMPDPKGNGVSDDAIPDVMARLNLRMVRLSVLLHRRTFPKVSA